MKIEIKVPTMGESITEATIGTILKSSGSFVKMDDELLELETDKVNQVLYAPETGVVNYSVNSEDVVKIGQVIGFIDSSAKAEPTEKEKVEQPKTAPAPLAPKAEEKAKPIPAKPKESIPPAEQYARITKEGYLEDIKSPKAPPPPSPKPTPKPGERSETRKKMSRIRKAIAMRLVEAQQTTAMLTTFNEADISQIIALREKYKETFVKEHGVKLGFMSFFVKACVSALNAFPDFNSYISGDDLVHREYYDIGVAVGTDRGVLVPVLKDCDQLTFAGIESAIESYAKKAREGTITADDLQGGCFTITNGGIYGSLLSTPILTPPQCGILGMHKIQKRPVVVDDQIIIKPMMYLALSYDHRIVDGKEAVSFLVHVKNCLEDPSRILLEI